MVSSAVFGTYQRQVLSTLRGGGGDNDAEVDDDESSTSVSRTMYNEQASNWVRTEPCCLSDFTGRPVVFSMLEDHITESHGATVLDVGCGEGYCARKVLAMGAAKVIGCDISSKMIDSAICTTASAYEDSSRFHFYVATCQDLKLEQHLDFLQKKEECADVALAVFLFNYLTCEEMTGAMKQIYMALKPGGIFVFSVPHPSMMLCDHNNDEDSVFRLDCENDEQGLKMGYYNSRNKKIKGQISTIKGEKLNIMSIHKTLHDYIKAINDSGFEILDIQEAGVTEEHLEMNPDFFESVKERPLHLIFKLEKK